MTGQAPPDTDAMTAATLDEIKDTFALLDDWEDRIQYVIDLGRGLAPLDAADRSDANKVSGCASQVWIATRREGRGDDAMLRFSGESDAHIVQGLIAILLAFYSGRRAGDILALDAGALFQDIGLSDHLTAQRANGARAMVARIKRDAQMALAAAA